MNDLHHRLAQAAADEGVPLRTDLPDLLRRARADRRRHQIRVSLAVAATTAVVLVGGGSAFQALAPVDGTSPAPAQAPSMTTAAEPQEDQWVLPVDDYRITTTFGVERSYYSSGYHTGLDFATGYGEPIKAVAGGEVTEIGYDGPYGNKTVITLADGTELWFSQQSAFAVEMGDQVKAGDVIGYVGSTGRSYGAHLHLEVRPRGGDPVDPADALAQHGVDVIAQAPADPPPTQERADPPATASASPASPSSADIDEWVRPVAGCRITERFGTKKPYSSGFHIGLDFRCRYGKPIRAITAGRITDVGYHGAYGNRTVLTLADGTELWFAHQSAFKVKKGDQVKAGEVIGYVGSTGNSVKPHLHLEVRPGGGDPVDPAKVLAEHGVDLNG